MTAVTEPVLPGCFPDPSICRVGEWYYLVCSTFEYLPGLPVMRSRDLLRWETIGHVIDRPDMLDFGGIVSSGGLYAPTIRHGRGLFWVVCTLVDPHDDSRGGNFLVTAADPAGPWSEPIMLDVGGIDPSVAFDEDGRVWMHGTRLAADPEWHHQTEVWVREYAPDERMLVGEEHVVWRGAVHGAVWAEGPHLYRIDGRWYLVAAEGGTEFHHATSVARADEVTGPYVGNRANPVFTHRHLGRGADVIGVGHADLVQAPDGSWHAVMLGMRAPDGVHYPLGREMFLCPVGWEDGWPVFAPGAGRLPRTPSAPWAEPSSPHTWQPDERSAGEIAAHDPRWTALRALPAHVAHVDGGVWRMPVRAATLRDADAAAFLGVRLQHADVDVHCTLDISDLRFGESAGLVVRQSERDHALAAVTRERGSVAQGTLTLSAEHCRGGERRVGERVALDDAERVQLTLRVRGFDCRIEHGATQLRNVDLRELDASSTGGFLGLWIGVFATSDGAPPRGAVRITGFDYAPASGMLSAPAAR